MDSPNTILVYSDYKSPYAFLAKNLIYELEDQFDVNLEWLPYTLDIPSYLGSARLDERGDVIESSRNAHQWRRVRYSYMDCRRQAALEAMGRPDLIKDPSAARNASLC
jgi:2-hydroxychromene-2-carboxylate isomerase